MNLYYTAIAQRANHRCEYCKALEVAEAFKAKYLQLVDSK